MDPRRYLLVKGFSGIGNRLRALAEAIIYAHLSGRTLVVDWNDRLYSSDGKDVFHRLFDVPGVGTISDVPAEATVAPALWSGQMERSFDWMMKEYRLHWGTEARAHLSIDPDVDYSETVAVFYDWTFRLPRLSDRPAPCPEEWRDVDATQILRRLLRDRIRPNTRIAATVDEFARARFEPPTIGVHIRQTDNMSAFWLERKGDSVAAFEAALEQQLRAEPNATVFLATDNRAVEKPYRRRYAPVVGRAKWYPPTPGEALQGHIHCPDKLRAAEDALVDLYLLSRCDVLVYSSRTTFAQCAVHLSTRPAVRLIDVSGPVSPDEAARWIALRAPWWWQFPRRAARAAFRQLRRAFDQTARPEQR